MRIDVMLCADLRRLRLPGRHETKEFVGADSSNVLSQEFGERGRSMRSHVSLGRAAVMISSRLGGRLGRSKLREKAPVSSETPSNNPSERTPDDAVRDLLGYLNFSSGAHDASFYRNVDQVVENLQPPTERAIRDFLLTQITTVEGTSAAFQDIGQVTDVVGKAFDEVLPAYCEHHSNLLVHLPADIYLEPYFLARLLEATLRVRAAEDVPQAALAELNGFLGYRPIPVLENGHRSEVYDNERHAPLPVYIKDAGVSSGRYRDLLDAALQLLRDTPAEIRDASYFDFDRLDVMAVDLRAHDHTHPANKRTNYMFGEWDPHLLDVDGLYRRFIVRKIILDALLTWIEREDVLEEAERANREERLFDAAAALAGTMLMASTISGAGPETHDSTVSLTTLLPVVARRRDEFYERLISEAEGDRAQRLKASAERTRQPFGHIRQHVNMTLSRYGAKQVQHRELANLFARMGFPEAARQEAETLPSVSIRFECEIQCRIGTAHRRLDNGDVAAAAEVLPELFDLLRKGIACGALVDPWCILGFAGQYPVFSAREDAIPDPRVEILMILVEGVLNVHSRVMTEAAAQGTTADGKNVRETVSKQFRAAAEWWDQFGSEIIEDLPVVAGVEAWESATHVADALTDWRAAGEEAGDISFWRKHVERFQSAHAYAPVVEALLDRKDFVASMGLLMQWLGQIDEAGMESARQNIFALLLRWMALATGDAEAGERSALVRRMLAVLEANAEELWAVPTLDEDDLSGDTDPADWMEDFESETEGADESGIYNAAYENVTYRDTTDDGNWGDTLGDGGGYDPDGGAFEELTRRLEPRLKFLHTVGQLWQRAAASFILDAHTGVIDLSDDTVSAAVMSYHEQAAKWQQDLLGLLKSAWQQGIDTIAGDQEANIEYDAQVQAKNYLLHQIIVTLVCLRSASRMLRCALPDDADVGKTEKFERRLTKIYRAILHRDDDLVREELPTLIAQLERLPLLYVPVENGGDPHQVLRVQTLQSILRWLLRELPARGLLREAWHVLRCSARMERNSRPAGPAITEFDRLFEISLRESLQTVMGSITSWDEIPSESVATLVGEVVEHYQEHWLRHSRTMRLSAVDYLRVDGEAAKIEAFIERYGNELFHASQLTLSHVRAILHHGIDWYLDYLSEFDDPATPLRLLEDISSGAANRAEVASALELIYSIIVDKYDRFLEYNTTTTQSDYGEKLFCFLDFLRLEAQYERDEWNLTPLVVTHEVMVRNDRNEAAAIWEDEFSQRMAGPAAEYPRGLQQLEGAYGMRMPAVADHLNERFVKPLAVNRMLAYVRQAIRLSAEGNQAAAETSFDLLRDEIKTYMEDRQGSGVEVPDWLQDLQDEADLADARVMTSMEQLESDQSALRAVLTRDQMNSQLERWSEPLRVARPEERRSTRRPKKAEDESS